MTLVRCTDRGFLAVRDVQTRELMETEVGMRKTWTLPTIHNTPSSRYDEKPICFAREYCLDEEIGSYTRERVVAVIEKERKCDPFIAWQHGFTPKEHQEMKNMELLKQEIEQRRQDDERRAEERRQADEKRAEERRLAVQRGFPTVS